MIKPNDIKKVLSKLDDEEFRKRIVDICTEVVDLLITKHKLSLLESLVIIQLLLEEHPAAKLGYKVYIWDNNNIEIEIEDKN